MEINDLANSSFSSGLKGLSTFIATYFLYLDVSRDAQKRMEFFFSSLLLPTKEIELFILQIHFFILGTTKLEVEFSLIRREWYSLGRFN